MKILLLPAYFYPEGVSSPYISRNRNQAFADIGWDMVVYTPTPSRGISKELRDEYRHKKFEKMLDGHLRVHRFSLIDEKKNPISRALRYFLQNFKQFIRAVFCKDGRDCDVMLIASTPPTQGAMAALVKKITKTPIVYNLQDIFPDSLVGTGLANKDGILWKIGRVIENFTYRNADKIIVISEGFKENIIAKGVPEDKIEVVYNWVDDDNIKPIEKERNTLYSELGINKDKFNVVYAGNLGNAQNIDIIIEAAKLLSDKDDIQFNIFGTGGLKEQYIEKAKEYKLKNIGFFPLQPIDKISEVYSLGDVCIISCKKGLGGAAMPSKMMSIMACGRPIIASFDMGEMSRMIEDNNCGIYTPAGNVNAFADAVKYLWQNPEICRAMGIEARNLAMKKFTKAIGTQRYIEILKSVVKE